MRIALTGNPNSGKTTMYNALTGRSERVGNWAGVTVDKKESPVKPQFNPRGVDLVAVNLPGAAAPTAREAAPATVISEKESNRDGATIGASSLFFLR